MSHPDYLPLLSELYGRGATLAMSEGAVFPIVTRSGPPIPPEEVAWNVIKDRRNFRLGGGRLVRRDGAWNGHTFVLRGGVDSDRGLRIHASPGRYFDTLDSGEALATELREGAAAYAAGRTARDCLSLMPCRAAAQGGRMGADALEQLWLGEARSAALGVTIAFVVPDPTHTAAGRYLLVAHRRSRHVAEDPGLFHLTPSFVLQPPPGSEDRVTPPLLRHAIVQETAEELFSLPEGCSVADARELPAIAELCHCLEDGRASLLITGVGLDLVSLRAELLGLLMVHDRSWSARFVPAMRLSSHEFETGFSSFELDDDALFEPGGPFAPGQCVWSAAACLTQALPLARRLGHADPRP